MSHCKLTSLTSCLILRPLKYVSHSILFYYQVCLLDFETSLQNLINCIPKLACLIEEVHMSHNHGAADRWILLLWSICHFPEATYLKKIHS